MVLCAVVACSACVTRADLFATYWRFRPRRAISNTSAVEIIFHHIGRARPTTLPPPRFGCGPVPSVCADRAVRYLGIGTHVPWHECMCTPLAPAHLSTHSRVTVAVTASLAKIGWVHITGLPDAAKMRPAGDRVSTMGASNEARLGRGGGRLVTQQVWDMD